MFADLNHTTMTETETLALVNVRSAPSSHDILSLLILRPLDLQAKEQVYGLMGGLSSSIEIMSPLKTLPHKLLLLSTSHYQRRVTRSPLRDWTHEVNENTSVENTFMLLFSSCTLTPDVCWLCLCDFLRVFSESSSGPGLWLLLTWCVVHPVRPQCSSAGLMALPVGFKTVHAAAATSTGNTHRILQEIHTLGTAEFSSIPLNFWLSNSLHVYWSTWFLDWIDGYCRYFPNLEQLRYVMLRYVSYVKGLNCLFWK